jgi:hypothetical protein
VDYGLCVADVYILVAKELASKSSYRAVLAVPITSPWDPHSELPSWVPDLRKESLGRSLGLTSPRVATASQQSHGYRGRHASNQSLFADICSLFSRRCIERIWRYTALGFRRRTEIRLSRRGRFRKLQENGNMIE